MMESAVYRCYSASEPPAHPGLGWVRFVLLSDTHSQTLSVPDGDVLLHAGDLTTLGEPDDLQAQLTWLQGMSHEVKVITGGNHDFSACTQEGWYQTRGRQLNRCYGVEHDASAPTTAARMLRECSGIRFLDNQTHSFVVRRPDTNHYTWKIHASPWSPVFEDWAWNYTSSEAKGLYARVGGDVDILVTHTPPYELGGLDRIHNGTSVGCRELTRRLTAPLTHPDALRPRLHLFGHIHEARGTHILHHPDPTPAQTILVNAALVDYNTQLWKHHAKFSYDVVAQPVIVDLRVPDA